MNKRFLVQSPGEEVFGRDQQGWDWEEVPVERVTMGVMCRPD